MCFESAYRRKDFDQLTTESTLHENDLVSFSPQILNWKSNLRIIMFLAPYNMRFYIPSPGVLNSMFDHDFFHLSLQVESSIVKVLWTFVEHIYVDPKFNNTKNGPSKPNAYALSKLKR